MLQMLEACNAHHPPAPPSLLLALIPTLISIIESNFKALTH